MGTGSKVTLPWANFPAVPSEFNTRCPSCFDLSIITANQVSFAKA
jgi:hypothetical protein